MQNYIEPTALAFVLQVFLLPIYIPLSYISYKLMKLPKKQEQIEEALAELNQLAFRREFDTVYSWSEYVGPIVLAYVLTLVTYTITHPYVIQQGWWAGIIEEVIDIFGANHPFPKAIVAGRFLFWGWLGGYIYSVYLTFSRFIEFDLTPSVYIFTAKRFFLAITVGAIVGVGIGTYATRAGVPFDIAMVTVSIVTFTIGFFPEQGLNWLRRESRKILNAERWSDSGDASLSEIQGLTIWQQTRLNQENIFSVQNLAGADITRLVIKTPYTLDQIIDWVDQAIFKTVILTNKDQLKKFNELSISRASEAIIAVRGCENLEDLTKELTSNEDLKIEQSDKDSTRIVSKRFTHWGKNMLFIIYYRWKYSLDRNMKEQAKKLLDKMSTPQKDDELKKEVEELMKIFDKQTVQSSYRFDKLLREENKIVKVYRGTNHVGEELMLKLIDTSSLDNPNNVSPYLQKIAAVKKLSILNIPVIKIHELGECRLNPDKKYFYVVMQYLEKQDSLGMFLDCLSKGRISRIEPKILLQIFRSLCITLDYAHSNRIIHGNIDPWNIFLNNKFAPILAGWDNGLILKVTSPSESLKSPYTAPEPKEEPQSDIYSVGVLLSELLTGQVPSQANGFDEIAGLNLTKRLKLPENSDANELNCKLQAIIGKATAMSPTNRYLNGIDLMKDMDSAFATIVDHPPSVAQNLGKNLFSKLLIVQ